MSLESKLQFLVNGFYAQIRLEKIAQDYDNTASNGLGKQREQPK